MRILVVEDEVLVAMDLAAMLEDMGATVVGPANDLNEALALAKTAAFDFAMLDLNLEGERSTAVADLLRHREIPFIFLTGYERDQLPEGFRSVGILSKPVAQRDVESALQDQGLPSNTGG